MLFCFVSEPVGNKIFFCRLLGRHKNVLHENIACRNDMTILFYNFMALFEGSVRILCLRNEPVPECLPLVHGTHDFD